MKPTILRSKATKADPQARVAILDSGEKLLLVLEHPGGGGSLGWEWPYVGLNGWREARAKATLMMNDLAADPHFPCTCVADGGVEVG